HESSVAAAEVDQPRFTNILQVNQSVPARHFGRFQHDRVSGGPSERTTATDRMACAIGCFQPGTFLWGYVHAETFYQELSIEATCLKSRGARARWHEPEQASGSSGHSTRKAFLSQVLAKRSDHCKAEPQGSAPYVSRRGNGYRGWFWRRSVRLVFAGLRGLGDCSSS